MSDSPVILPDPEETLEVSPASVLSWLERPAGERPRLIDCREADELAICQIAGNEWMPLGQFPEALPFFTRDASRGIVIYCHHGVRSAHAASFLRAHGLKNAYSLAGGTDFWSRTIDPEMPRY